jgi:hypothetical protein
LRRRLLLTAMCVRQALVFGHPQADRWTLTAVCVRQALVFGHPQADRWTLTAVCVRQALVFGHPRADRWTVDAPITKDQHCPKGFKMKIAEDGEDGKQSQTQVTNRKAVTQNIPCVRPIERLALRIYSTCDQ